MGRALLRERRLQLEEHHSEVRTVVPRIPSYRRHLTIAQRQRWVPGLA